MRILHRRTARAVCVAAAAMLVAASSALGGGGFGPTIQLRSAPIDREILVGDIGARNDNAVVVWQESGEEDGGTPRIRYRLTANGGDTFGPLKVLDTRDAEEPSADVCAGYAWMAYGLHTPDADPGEWEVVLKGVRTDGSPGYSAALLTDPFEYDDAHFPDVACVGARRHIVAWVNETGFTDEIHIQLLTITGVFEGIPNYFFGPYSGHTSGGVAVTATNTMAYAAWVRINPDTGTERLRFKRFDVGPDPDSIVTGHPIQNPSTFTTGVHDPKLAAHGSTVVLAYVRNGNIWVQISDDYGVSFGPRHKVIDPPEDFGSALWSVTVRGSRIVLEGIQLYGDFSGGVIDPIRATSLNGGGTWTLQHPGGTGARVGVITGAGAGGGPHLLEAWDQRYSAQAHDKLRFHAEE